jgi:hypothetical protein
MIEVKRMHKKAVLTVDPEPLNSMGKLLYTNSDSSA